MNQYLKCIQLCILSVALILTTNVCYAKEAAQEIALEIRIVEASRGWGIDMNYRIKVARLRPFRGGCTMARTEEVNHRKKEDIAAYYFLTNKQICPDYFTFQLQRSFTRYVALELQALEQESYGRILETVHLTTLDSITAHVEQNLLIAHQNTVSLETDHLSFGQIPLAIDITPYVQSGGNINLEIQMRLNLSGNNEPVESDIRTQDIKWQVDLAHGDIAVIGSAWFGNTYIPLPSDRIRNACNDGTELLLFITPRFAEPSSLQ